MGISDIQYVKKRVRIQKAVIILSYLVSSALTEIVGHRIQKDGKICLKWRFKGVICNILQTFCSIMCYTNILSHLNNRNARHSKVKFTYVMSDDIMLCSSKHLSNYFQ